MIFLKKNCYWALWNAFLISLETITTSLISATNVTSCIINFPILNCLVFQGGFLVAHSRCATIFNNLFYFNVYGCFSCCPEKYKRVFNLIELVWVTMWELGIKFRSSMGYFFLKKKTVLLSSNHCKIFPLLKLFWRECGICSLFSDRMLGGKSLNLDFLVIHNAVCPSKEIFVHLYWIKLRWWGRKYTCTSPIS